MFIIAFILFLNFTNFPGSKFPTKFSDETLYERYLIPELKYNSWMFKHVLFSLCSKHIVPRAVSPRRVDASRAHSSRDNIWRSAAGGPSEIQTQKLKRGGIRRLPQEGGSERKATTEHDAPTWLARWQIHRHDRACRDSDAAAQRRVSNACYSFFL